MVCVRCCIAMSVSLQTTTLLGPGCWQIIEPLTDPWTRGAIIGVASCFAESRDGAGPWEIWTPGRYRLFIFTHCYYHGITIITAIITTTITLSSSLTTQQK